MRYLNLRPASPLMTIPQMTPLVTPQVISPIFKPTINIPSPVLSPGLRTTSTQRALDYEAGRRPGPRYMSAEERAIRQKQQASIALSHVSPAYSPVQNAINKILGATPEHPITLPIQLPPVTIEASPATQQGMFTNIALLGAIGIGIALILRR